MKNFLAWYGAISLIGTALVVLWAWANYRRNSL
jgi:hypothetical protein